MIKKTINKYFTVREIKTSDLKLFLEKYPKVVTYIDQAYNSHQDAIQDLRSLFNQKMNKDKSLPNSTAYGLFAGITCVSIPYLFFGASMAILPPALITTALLTGLGFLFEYREKKIASATYRRDVLSFAKEIGETFYDFDRGQKEMLDQLSPTHQDMIKQDHLLPKKPASLSHLYLRNDS